MTPTPHHAIVRSAQGSMCGAAECSAVHASRQMGQCGDTVANRRTSLSVTSTGTHDSQRYCASRGLHGAPPSAMTQYLCRDAVRAHCGPRAPAGARRRAGAGRSDWGWASVRRWPLKHGAWRRTWLCSYARVPARAQVSQAEACRVGSSSPRASRGGRARVSALTSLRGSVSTKWQSGASQNCLNNFCRYGNGGPLTCKCGTPSVWAKVAVERWLAVQREVCPRGQ